jgi:predicted TIM-barrel fold metal-dependent hydrolase
MGNDNRYSLEGAAQFPDDVLGVIGRFDPLAPDVEGRLKEFQSNPLLLGIRITLITPQSESWLRDKALDRFFAAAQRLDVAVQLHAPYQRTEMRAVLRQFPGIRFLIDHMGLRTTPARPVDEVFREWDQLLALAEEPNAWIKVSFFPSAAQLSEKFPFPKARQRLKELYERVGAGRMVWGSDFPGVAKICTYRESLDFILEADFFSEDDKAAITGLNFLRDFGPARPRR